MVRRNKDQYNWDELEFDETILNKHYTPLSRRDIKFVVIHHMIIKDRDLLAPDALDTCWNVWQDRPASAHYGVDNGFVRQYVWDKDYAWANGNTYANNHALSIEHANQTLDMPGTANDYLINEETWKTGARLVAHIHKKYNLGLPTYGTTIRKHQDFSSTGCPGQHLLKILPNEYTNEARRVYNEIMAGGDSKPVPPPPSPKTAHVVLRGDTLGRIAIRYGTTVKKLQEINKIEDPNVIYVGQTIQLGVDSARKSNEELAKEVIAGKWGNGAQRVNALRTSGYDPLAVQSAVNNLLR